MFWFILIAEFMIRNYGFIFIGIRIIKMRQTDKENDFYIECDNSVTSIVIKRRPI